MDRCHGIPAYGGYCRSGSFRKFYSVAIIVVRLTLGQYSSWSQRNHTIDFSEGLCVGAADR